MRTLPTPTDDHRLRRQVQAIASFSLAGVAAAVMVRSGLGLDPWSVLHQGLAESLPITFGAASAMVGAVVLLVLRVFGRQPARILWFGLIVAAVAADTTLALVPEPGLRDIEIRCAMLPAGVLGTATAVALGLGAGVGVGGATREALSGTLVERLGLTPVQARTLVEGSVGTVGFALGGVVNFGTVFAVLTVGPLVRVLAPRFDRQAKVSSTAMTASARVSGLMNASRSTVRPRHFVGTQSITQASATSVDQRV